VGVGEDVIEVVCMSDYGEGGGDLRDGKDSRCDASACACALLLIQYDTGRETRHVHSTNDCDWRVSSRLKT
jgi:hypothetical protein